jgi:hypothetical protein
LHACSSCQGQRFPPLLIYIVTNHPHMEHGVTVKMVRALQWTPYFAVHCVNNATHFSSLKRENEEEIHKLLICDKWEINVDNQINIDSHLLVAFIPKLWAVPAIL